MSKKNETKTARDFDGDIQEPEGSALAVPESSEFDKRLAALNSQDEFESFAAEHGLKQVQVDVSGYWEPDMSPIFGELLGIAKAIETELGVTGIYAFKLLRPCACRLGSKQESDVDILETGSIVGVFHSVGLNPLKNMAGAKVAIRRTGKQSLSGGRTMWNYDIIADGKRAPIEIVDNRSPENSGAPF